MNTRDSVQIEVEYSDDDHDMALPNHLAPPDVGQYLILSAPSHNPDPESDLTTDATPICNLQDLQANANQMLAFLNASNARLIECESALFPNNQFNLSAAVMRTDRDILSPIEIGRQFSVFIQSFNLAEIDRLIPSLISNESIKEENTEELKALFSIIKQIVNAKHRLSSLTETIIHRERYYSISEENVPRAKALLTILKNLDNIILPLRALMKEIEDNERIAEEARKEEALRWVDEQQHVAVIYTEGANDRTILGVNSSGHSSLDLIPNDGRPRITLNLAVIREMSRRTFWDHSLAGSHMPTNAQMFAFLMDGNEYRRRGEGVRIHSSLTGAEFDFEAAYTFAKLLTESYEVLAALDHDELNGHVTSRLAQIEATDVQGQNRRIINDYQLYSKNCSYFAWQIMRMLGSEYHVKNDFAFSTPVGARDYAMRIKQYQEQKHARAVALSPELHESHHLGRAARYYLKLAIERINHLKMQEIEVPDDVNLRFINMRDRLEFIAIGNDEDVKATMSEFKEYLDALVPSQIDHHLKQIIMDLSNILNTRILHREEIFDAITSNTNALFTHQSHDDRNETMQTLGQARTVAYFDNNRLTYEHSLVNKVQQWLNPANLPISDTSIKGVLQLGVDSLNLATVTIKPAFWKFWKENKTVFALHETSEILSCNEPWVIKLQRLNQFIDTRQPSALNFYRRKERAQYEALRVRVSMICYLQGFIAGECSEMTLIMAMKKWLPKLHGDSREALSNIRKQLLIQYRANVHRNKQNVNPETSYLGVLTKLLERTHQRGERTENLIDDAMLTAYSAGQQAELYKFFRDPVIQKARDQAVVRSRSEQNPTEDPAQANPLLNRAAFLGYGVSAKQLVNIEKRCIKLLR